MVWHGRAPGARLGAGRNGRSGRALKEKGTGEPSPPSPSASGRGVNSQYGPSYRRPERNMNRRGGGPESGERSQGG